MSEFLDTLDARQIGWKAGRPIWLTLAPMRYQSDTLKATLVIPAETITDLASVPRLPLSWLVAGMRGNRSAVPHDFAYQFGYWLLVDGQKLVATREMADEVFYESLVADPLSGAGRFEAWLMYASVRAMGWHRWGQREERTPILNPEWATDEGIVLPADEPPDPVLSTDASAPNVVSVTAPASQETVAPDKKNVLP